MSDNQERLTAIRLLIVDDHPIYVDGLRNHLVGIATGIEVIGEAHNGRSAYDLTATLKPDVVLMDMFLHDSEVSGIEATRRIKSEFPNVQVIILSADSSIDSIMGALQAGATGYLLKSVGIDELVDAILTVFSHGSKLSPEISQKLISYWDIQLLRRTRLLTARFRFCS